MPRVLLWAIVTSLLMAVVVTVTLLLTVNQIAVLKEGAQYPQDFDRWSFHDQNEWRLKNQDFISGLGYVRERIKHPGFAQELLVSSTSVFAVSFLSCLVFAFLSRSCSEAGGPGPDHEVAP
jgi:hypothetical protein